MAASMMMMPPMMMNNNNGVWNNNNNYGIIGELPSAGGGELCEACFCPCCVFGKLVSRLSMNSMMMGNNYANTMNRTACISWSFFTLVVWGLVSTGVQLMLAQIDGSGNIKYAVYALYLLYYVGYMVPFLQAMSIYRSLKAIHSGNAQQGVPVVPAPEPCQQWCVFMVCPCSFLGSAHRYVSQHASGISLDRDSGCGYTLQVGNNNNNSMMMMMPPNNGGGVTWV